MNYIKALQEAIRKTHGCESKHTGSVPVEEEFKGQTIWSGVVEVFEIINHPMTSVCYAWAHHLEKGKAKSRYVTVLKIPPVISPETAVKASIIADSQE